MKNLHIQKEKALLREIKEAVKWEAAGRMRKRCYGDVSLPETEPKQSHLEILGDTVGHLC